jgi:UvrD-like helicase C-terminal domain/AAA domain
VTIALENALALGPSQENALDRVGEWLKNAPPVRYCNDAECLGYRDAEDEMPHTHGGAQDYDVLSIGGLAGCVAGETELWDPIARKGRRIDELCRNGERPWVQTLAGPVLAEVPFLKGMAPLYRVTLRNGYSCLATADHLFLSDSHWRRTDSLVPGMALLSTRTGDAQHYSGTAEGYPGDCCRCLYSCGAPLPPGSVAALSSAPSHSGAQSSVLGPLSIRKYSPLSRRHARLSMPGSAHLGRGETLDASQVASLAILGAGYHSESNNGGQTTDLFQQDSLSRGLSRLQWPFSRRDHDSERKLNRNSACEFCAGMRCRSVACSLLRHLAAGHRAPQQFHEAFFPEPRALRSARGDYGTGIAGAETQCHVGACNLLLPAPMIPQAILQSADMSFPERRELRSHRDAVGKKNEACYQYTSQWSQVVAVEYERTDNYYDLHVPGQEHYLADGIWSHNTGKTALAGQLANRLGVRVTFGTPTNKAAWVLRHKLPQEQRNRCGTYHSLLFRPNSWHSCLASGEIAGELGCACGLGFDDDDCACPRFKCPDARCVSNAEGCRVESHLTFDRREYAGGHRDLLVLDEASMITEEQVDAIKLFGLPVLLVGDHGQLSPVKGSVSPWMLKPDIELTENYRQSESSGIIRAALTARKLGTIPLGRYGDSTVVMNGSSRPDAYEALSPARLVPGQQSMIVTWTNARRADINRAIHAAIADGNPAVIIAGERVTSLGTYDCSVMKPDDNGGWRAAGWTTKVANGISGTVLQVLSMSRKTADVVIRLDGHPGEEPGRAVKVVRRIDLGQLGNPKSLRPDERVAAAWDYAFCRTVHKSQGDEADRVALVGNGPSGPDRARFLYTAMTRAKSKLLVIL